MKNGIGQRVDIAVLQEKIGKIDADVSKILNNHLPHIEGRLNIIDKKMAYYSGGLAIAVFLIEWFLK